MSDTENRIIGSAELSNVIMESVVDALPTIAVSSENVKATLPKNFKFSESTDLGMIVRRAIDVLVIENADMSAENFRAVFEAEPMCRRDVAEVAFRLARLARGSYSALSENVAPVVEALVEKTEEKIASLLKNGTQKDVVVEHFSWGALSDPIYLNTALSVCLDEANVFRQDLDVRLFYKDSCMKHVPSHMPKSVSAEDISATEEFLEGKLPAEQKALAVTFVTRAFPFQNLTADAGMAVKSKAAFPSIELVNGMASALEVISAVQNARTQDKENDLPAAVVENINQIETALYLIHGALEVKRELEFSKSVFLGAKEVGDSIVVYANEDAFADFEQTGGTDKNLADLGKYLVSKKSINANMTIQTESLVDMIPKATAVVEDMTAREIRAVQDNETQAYRKAMSSVMLAWLGDLYRNSDYQRVPLDVAQAKVSRAVTEATRPTDAVPVSDGYADVVLTVVDCAPMKTMQNYLRDAFQKNPEADKKTLQAKAVTSFINDCFKAYA